MKEKKFPERKCIGCGQMRPKNQMIRVAASSDGCIAVDPTGRWNGRGAYLCRDPKCVALAKKSHRLEGSLKRKVPAEIYEQLKEALEKNETG